MITVEKFTILAHKYSDTMTHNCRKLVLCVILDPSSESGNFWIHCCAWEELKCAALNQCKLLLML